MIGHFVRGDNTLYTCPAVDDRQKCMYKDRDRRGREGETKGKKERDERKTREALVAD